MTAAVDAEIADLEARIAQHDRDFQKIAGKRDMTEGDLVRAGEIKKARAGLQARLDALRASA